MKLNMKNFRVFGPDENTSNKLHDIYTVSKKFWIEDYFPEDADGGELAPDGRVIEMLSEHTLEGMLEGYLLTGRHGFFSSYEAFIHVIDSMFNQHAKWLSICNHLSWRESIASLNMFVTSTVWRQDHNGFTHQDPGFLDVVVNKSAEVTRIYLPPDVNCLLSVANHCLKSENYVNVIVCDKQLHLQYMDMDAAIAHCTKGIGIWEWACNDQGSEPDVVMASAGDIPTQEALAAICLLREEFPDLKIRYINVVDLFKLQPSTEHPHGLSDRETSIRSSPSTSRSSSIFTDIHGSSIDWLTVAQTTRTCTCVATRRRATSIHRWSWRSITKLTASVWQWTSSNVFRRLQRIGAHAMEKFRNMQIACRNYAYEHGTDKPEVAGWRWPH